MKIAVGGISGKMGKALYESVKKRPDAEIICGVDIIPNDLPIKRYSSFKEVLELPDVIIDFSRPALLKDLLAFATKNHIPSVLATTGYAAEEEKLIDEASEKIAIFKSGNMSVAVNLLIELCKRAQQVLSDCKIHITETHHIHKVDAPSGTAKMINEALDNKAEITSVREGEIIGIHSVDFDLPNEKLTICHTAKDRSLFADGALSAAKYITGKTAGKYNMQNILNEVVYVGK